MTNCRVSNNSEPINYTEYTLIDLPGNSHCDPERPKGQEQLPSRQSPPLWHVKSVGQNEPEKTNMSLGV